MKSTTLMSLPRSSRRVYVLTETKPVNADELPFSGQTFVVTGTLESMGRSEAREKLQKLGQKWQAVYLPKLPVLSQVPGPVQN